MSTNIRKAPVNLATGSTEMVASFNGLLNLHYYNLYSTQHGPTVVHRGVGNNWTTPQFVRLRRRNNRVVIDFAPGRKGKVYRFQRIGSVYRTVRDTHAKLTTQGANGPYRLTEQSGKVTIFNRSNGTIRESIDTNGVVTKYLKDGSSNRIGEIRTCTNDGTQDVVESRKFVYWPADSTGRINLRSVTLRRATGTTTPSESDFVDVRRAELVYYSANLPDKGSVGDLQLIKEQTPVITNGVTTSWQDEQTQHFRYYTSGAGKGFKHGLKYTFSGNECACLMHSSPNNDPLEPNNEAAKTFAGVYFEYDNQRRVSMVKQDGGKLRNNTRFWRNTNSITDLHNHWYRKATYTADDGSLKTVYSNRVGADILVEDKDADGKCWITYRKFNSRGQLIEKVHASAITGYDDTANDLNVQIKPDEGLIELTTWHADSHKRQSTLVKKGANGTPIKLTQSEYETCTLAQGTSSERTVHKLKRQVTYRSDTGDGDPVETTYAYQWHANSLQPSKVTTSLPDVPAEQNGINYPQSNTTVAEYDELGRMTRQTDARGTITEYQYDLATGAQIQMTQDVGGLAIVTNSTVDDRGRTIEQLGPEHDVDGETIRTATWTVYQGDYETWSAQGYQKSNGQNVLVNPISISRRSVDGMTVDSIAIKHGSNVETTTALATIAAAGVPAHSNWVRWSQTLNDANGRTLESRVYHDIPATGEGGLGADYTATKYDYDDMGRQNTMVSPAGTITRTDYNTRSMAVSTWVGTVDEGAGNNMLLISKNEYDPNGLLRQTITPQDGDSNNDRRTRYEYDWRKRTVATINVGPASDIISRQTLNNQGSSVRSETFSVATTTGDPLFGVELLISRSETLTDNRGRSYRSIQYGVHQETGELTGEMITVDSFYDAAGSLVKQTPAGGSDFALTQYDALGRATVQTNALGSTRTTTYNAASQAVAQTNELGHTSTSVYDGIGRMVKTINAVGDVTESEYDSAGLAFAQIDPLGNRTESTFDAAGRQVAITDAAGNVSTVAYNPSGQVASQTDALGNSASFEYDFRGRQTKVTDPMGDMTQSVYNRSGSVVAQVDAKGNSTFHQYDSLGRRTQTTDRLGGITQFAFDRAGRQASITDAEGGVTEYGFDDFSRQATTQYPDHDTGSVVGDPDYGIVLREYDNRGRLLRRTDQQGNSVTHNYDVVGRLTSRDYRSFGSTAILDSDTFTYDLASQMLSAVSGRYNNTASFSYDTAGRQASEAQIVGGQTYTTGYGYDAASRVSTITYPDGSVVERDYNSRGLLSEVSLDSNTIDTRTYDSRGLLKQSTCGNGVITDFTYRDDGRVSQIVTTNSGAQKIGTYAYSYDANKNKMSESIFNAGPMDDFGFGQAPTGYDSEDRLTTWKRSDGNQDQNWSLSPVGDWNQSSENGNTTTYGHNAAHELTSVATTNINYDANGNPLQTAAGLSLTWDVDSRLVTADDHSFQYDALGRRVSINDGNATKVLVCSGQQLIATYQLGDAASSPEQTFVYGSYIDEPILLSDFRSPNSELAYFSRNQQFSVTALTNNAGEVTERYAYDAYGSTLIFSPAGTPRATSTAGNPFTFTGRYHHPEIGLMYFRARYYEPHTGRFIGRDPLQYVDGMSLYRAYFVPGDVDPSGFAACAACEVLSWTVKFDGVADEEEKIGLSLWHGRLNQKARGFNINIGPAFDSFGAIHYANNAQSLAISGGRFAWSFEICEDGGKCLFSMNEEGVKSFLETEVVDGNADEGWVPREVISNTPFEDFSPGNQPSTIMKFPKAATAGCQKRSRVVIVDVPNEGNSLSSEILAQVGNDVYLRTQMVNVSVTQTVSVEGVGAAAVTFNYHPDPMFGTPTRTKKLMRSRFRIGVFSDIENFLPNGPQLPHFYEGWAPQ